MRRKLRSIQHRRLSSLRRREVDVQVVDGPERFLDLVETDDIPMAVATSATKVRTMRLLNQHTLTDGFKAIITDDDVASGKSNAEIFLKVAERLGVSARNILVFEDAIHFSMAARS